MLWPTLRGDAECSSSPSSPQEEQLQLGVQEPHQRPAGHDLRVAVADRPALVPLGAPGQARGAAAQGHHLGPPQGEPWPGEGDRGRGEGEMGRERS